jgi:hypothetical protein
LHCSFDSCKKEYALCDAVGAVYGSQGFKAEEAGEKAAAAVEESGEEESGSDIKPAAKKQRRHSGGSSGATAQASVLTPDSLEADVGRVVRQGDGH